MPESTLSWVDYQKAAKKIKKLKPKTTPQSIIKQIGSPVKNGKIIRITSDGEGGIKERNVKAQTKRERLRQRRLRIQTGKLSKEDTLKSRELKTKFREGGNEADHINESWLLGSQLERIEAKGGMPAVEQALDTLKKSGYQLGNMPGNLQQLSPEENKEKYNQTKNLQNYLGSRESLGQSPSARRVDLFQTGYTPPTLGGFQQQEPELIFTKGGIKYNPPKLQPSQKYSVPKTPVTPKVDMSPSVMGTVSDVVETATPYVVGAGAAIGGLMLNIGKGVATMLLNAPGP
tara:strand:- start:2768 stop:3631 length:864 start_codon:yes stop_codon:yes gene_type:complete